MPTALSVGMLVVGWFRWLLSGNGGIVFEFFVAVLGVVKEIIRFARTFIGSNGNNASAATASGSASTSAVPSSSSSSEEAKTSAQNAARVMQKINGNFTGYVWKALNLNKNIMISFALVNLVLGGYAAYNLKSESKDTSLLCVKQRLMDQRHLVSGCEDAHRDAGPWAFVRNTGWYVVEQTPWCWGIKCMDIWARMTPNVVVFFGAVIPAAFLAWTVASYLWRPAAATAAGSQRDEDVHAHME